MEIATYRYQRVTGVYPVHSYVWYEMKVEILEDTGKRLRVKFLGYHADGRPPGSVTTVEYKSVKRANVVDVGKTPTKEDVNTIKQFIDRFDPELTRKPYKDD